MVLGQSCTPSRCCQLGHCSPATTLEPQVRGMVGLLHMKSPHTDPCGAQQSAGRQQDHCTPHFSDKPGANRPAVLVGKVEMSSLEAPQLHEKGGSNAHQPRVPCAPTPTKPRCPENSVVSSYKKAGGSSLGKRLIAAIAESWFSASAQGWQRGGRTPCCQMYHAGDSATPSPQATPNPDTPHPQQ